MDEEIDVGLARERLLENPVALPVAVPYSAAVQLLEESRDGYQHARPCVSYGAGPGRAEVTRVSSHPQRMPTPARLRSPRPAALSDRCRRRRSRRRGAG